jgi:ABC-2 type transport system permease protein
VKILAFVKRDILVAVSYRFRLILDFGRLFVTLFMFYFIDKTFGGAISPYLERYGGDYFPYVLIGMSASSFVSVGLDAFSDEIRAAQVEGTLEALLCTPTSIYTILIGNSIWSFLEAFGGTVFLLGTGVIFMGLHFTFSQFCFVIIVLILTLFAFIAVGMLSASFIMIFKQGNPIGMIFGTSSYFLGGIIFPVEVLPRPFQFMAEFLPITHAVKALREILLAQVKLNTIIPVIIKLFIFIAFLSPVSILFFRYAVRRAKKDGSLVQY